MGRIRAYYSNWGLILLWWIIATCSNACKNVSSCCTEKYDKDSGADVDSGEEFSARVVQLALGFIHSCAIVEDGRVICWGNNSFGQWVDGDDKENAIEEITAGQYFTCALNYVGEVKCFGDNEEAQTEAPAILFREIDAGDYHVCGILEEDSSVECWGAESNSMQDYGVTDVPEGLIAGDVYSGGINACVIASEDGQATCWGNGSFGLLDLPEAEFMQLAVGPTTICGIDYNSKIYCWGHEVEGSTQPPQVEEYVDISAGRLFSCALEKNGTPVCWGAGKEDTGEWGYWGQATPPEGVVFTDIETGTYHSCGIDEDGKVTCWGRDLYGETNPPGEISAK